MLSFLWISYCVHKPFSIFNNKISGTLPSEIGDWRLMVSGRTPFVSGTCTASASILTMFYCHKLQFVVTGNDLSGSLPSSIGNWNRLEIFSIHGNRFTSTLPDTISSWTSITNFDVGLRDSTVLFNSTDRRPNTNNLNGTLPSAIGSFRNVALFSCFNNSFTGSIPTSIGDGSWSSIDVFDLGSNELASTLPTTLGN